jgi:hypothetical protein
VANQKQRRRRAKEKRHDYDLVEIDAEGNETVLSASDLKPDEPAKPPAKAKGGKGSSPPATRGGRPLQPPSWRRVAKRGLIFAPIFFATVLLLGGGRITWVGAAVQTLLLLAVFIPFSYVMDRFVYRSGMKRLAKQSGSS